MKVPRVLRSPTNQIKLLVTAVLAVSVFAVANAQTTTPRSSAQDLPQCGTVIFNSELCSFANGVQIPLGEEGVVACDNDPRGSTELSVCCRLKSQCQVSTQPNPPPDQPPLVNNSQCGEGQALCFLTANCPSNYVPINRSCGILGNDNGVCCSPIPQDQDTEDPQPPPPSTERAACADGKDDPRIGKCGAEGGCGGKRQACVATGESYECVDSKSFCPPDCGDTGTIEKRGFNGGCRENQKCVEDEAGGAAGCRPVVTTVPRGEDEPATEDPSCGAPVNGRPTSCSLTTIGKEIAEVPLVDGPLGANVPNGCTGAPLTGGLGLFCVFDGSVPADSTGGSGSSGSSPAAGGAAPAGSTSIASLLDQIENDALPTFAFRASGGNNTIASLFNANQGILFWIFFLAGVALIIYLIIGGFKYLTSGGDPKAAGAAKQIITNAIIGFIIIFAAFWIIQLLGSVLGLTAVTSTFN